MRLRNALRPARQMKREVSYGRKFEVDNMAEHTQHPTRSSSHEVAKHP